MTFANDIFAASGFAVGPTGRVRVGTGYFDVTGTGAALWLMAQSARQGR